MFLFPAAQIGNLEEMCIRDSCASLSARRAGRRNYFRAYFRQGFRNIAAACIRPADSLWRHSGGAIAMIFLNFLIGLGTGVLSGFGIGGGSLLILYLTSFAGVNQYVAGGINLLYFIFCAPAALVSHTKNKLIEKNAVIFCTIAGVFTSVGASYLASAIDVSPVSYTHLDVYKRQGLGFALNAN